MKNKTDKWEEEFINRFCGTGRFIDSDSFQECLSFIRSLLLHQQEKMKGQTKRIWYQKGYKDSKEKHE